MAYIKNTWVDQDVERPKTYEVTNNEDGSITLTDSFGLVTELGTPVNEVNMNHIEDGIDGCAIRKHNLTETFNLDEWVLGGTGDDEGIYKSLVSNNVGNAITDDTKWEKVEMGGNTRNIGEVVVSSMPLTDAGLHLLDGALISGSGSYTAFIDYIADLYNSGDYTDLFTTEATWQTAVTTYGVCAQYVYDSVNNTVRLPKWGDRVVTKANVLNVASTVPVRGNGKSLGLTNGTKNSALVSATGDTPSNIRYLGNSQSLYGSSVGATTSQIYAQHTGNSAGVGVTTDAVESGLIANTGGNITLSQYTITAYYYVVIATSTKTDIEVDIDEIATDLNGKADVDLTNLADTGKVAIAHNAMPSNTKYYAYTAGASGSTYTAVSDGYLMVNGSSTNTSDTLIAINNATNFQISARGGANGYLRIYLPVAKGGQINVQYTSGVTLNQVRLIYAVGSESEAS